MNMKDLLNNLRASLKHNDDLYTIWHHFYRLTALTDVFSKSKNEVLPQLQEAISEVLIDSFAVLEPIPVREYVALRLTGSGFYHGLSGARGMIMTYFYFVEINAGIVAVPTQGDHELYRFSLQAEQEYSNLITNPPLMVH